MKKHLLRSCRVARWAVLPLLALAAPAAWGQVAFTPQQAYASAGVNPYGIAVGDLNADGLPDLVFANTNSATVGVMLASATVPGAFGAARTYGIGGGGVGQLVSLGDVNADGRLDVVVMNATAGRVVVLLGSATAPGTLQAATSYDASAVGTDNRQAALADVNGDGRPDVVVSSFASGRLGVLLGSATVPGTFGAPTLYPTGGQNISAVVVADLNADGRPDLVAADALLGQAYVLPGLAAAAGTFGPALGYVTGGRSYGLAVGDVNADGRPDVLTANTSANTVSVLLNSATAPGTLLPAVAYATGGTNTVELALGDLNNDGRPDVAVSNQDNGTVGVLLGSATAPGTFGPATTYAVGIGPRSLVVADVNRDNRRDLVIANFGNNTIGVLLNTTVLAAAPALAAAEVTLYPNPAHAGCAVQVPAVAGATAVRAELLNALGQLVQQQAAPLPAGGTTLALATATLPAGVYLLRLAALDAQGAGLGRLPTQRLVVE